MGDCIATPFDLSDIASKDTNRIVGRIAESLVGNSVFINMLEGGVFEQGTSDTQRSVVQMPAAPGDSLAIPTFVDHQEACGTIGQQDLADTIEFLYRLETKRGYGPRVCMNQGYSAFKDSYIMAEDSLVKLVTQYINADIRAQLYLRSGSKFVAAAGYCFDDLFTGGEHTDVNTTLFANVLPTGPLNFKTLHALARYLKEALYADMWPGGGQGQPHFRFVAGPDQIETLRADTTVRHDAFFLAAGRYRFGDATLQGYSFENSPAYRGLAFGVDQTPLRATGFNPDGTLAVVNPRLIVRNPAKNTAYSVHNPAWLRAEYEVGFLVAPNSFKRLVPERYVGEGSFRFNPQLHMGELKWHYQVDNDCNVFGDFGWHIYQIIRAYKPVRPHFVIPILYKRCPGDLGLEPCTDTSCAPLVTVV
jgi:hypothetical protein